MGEREDQVRVSLRSVKDVKVTVKKSAIAFAGILYSMRVLSSSWLYYIYSLCTGLDCRKKPSGLRWPSDWGARPKNRTHFCSSVYIAVGFSCSLFCSPLFLYVFIVYLYFVCFNFCAASHGVIKNNKCCELRWTLSDKLATIVGRQFITLSVHRCVQHEGRNTARRAGLCAAA